MENILKKVCIEESFDTNFIIGYAGGRGGVKSTQSLVPWYQNNASTVRVNGPLQNICIVNEKILHVTPWIAISLLLMEMINLNFFTMLVTRGVS